MVQEDETREEGSRTEFCSPPLPKVGLERRDAKFNMGKKLQSSPKRLRLLLFALGKSERSPHPDLPLPKPNYFLASRGFETSVLSLAWGGLGSIAADYVLCEVLLLFMILSK